MPRKKPVQMKKKPTAIKKTRGKKSLKDVDPDDHVEKLSTVDALNFGKLDAEVRNHLLSQKNIEYQINEIRMNARTQIAALQDQKTQSEMEVKRISVEYNELVQRIADRFGLDPKQMAVDPDKGTVRDLRK